MKQYYIVSLKRTSRADSWITLWAKDARGYTLNKEWAGLFDEGYVGSDLCMLIEKDVLDPLFVVGEVVNYEGWKLLPNSEEVRKLLNIDPKKMRPKKYKTC